MHSSTFVPLLLTLAFLAATSVASAQTTAASPLVASIPSNKALAIAEALILCSDEASARQRIQQDRAGAQSLLGVAADVWQIEGVGAHVVDPLGKPPYFLFYPFASWAIDALATYPAQFGELVYRS